MLANAELLMLAVGCACWFPIAAVVIFNMRHTPKLQDLETPPPKVWPKLSIIIPACNEGATLDSTMRDHLRETYPQVEVILVDDRSTDDTGAIADRFAAEDPRLRVIHVNSLPDSWLGKVHALQLGVDSSDGDWILFTDADVHVAPGTLTRLIAWCEHRGLDHVAAVPRIEARSFPVAMVNALLVRLAMMVLPVTKLEDPNSPAAAGAGAFNLFRRSALDRSPGVAQLRMEVIDDVALGRLLKAYGARCGLVNGAAGVSLCWYPSFRAMKRGFEKNGFAVASYNGWLLLAMCATLIFLEWAPYAALLQAGHERLQELGAMAALLGVGVTVALSRWLHFRMAPAFFVPIAAPIMAYFLLRSGVLALLNGGVVWRDTLYPLETLRAFRHDSQAAYSPDHVMTNGLQGH